MFVADRSSGGGEDASPIFGFTGYRHSSPALISRNQNLKGRNLSPALFKTKSCDSQRSYWPRSAVISNTVSWPRK